MKENEELSFPEAVLSSSFPNLWLERKRDEMAEEIKTLFSFSRDLSSWTVFGQVSVVGFDVPSSLGHVGPYPCILQNGD